MKLKKKANNPVFALNCLLQGLKLLGKPELRKFLIIPVFINLVLYTAVFSLGYWYLSDLLDQLIPSWLSWLAWLIWPLFFASISVTAFFTFTVVANLMAAPFYSRLAAKAMDVITGKENHIAEQPLGKVLLAELKRAFYMLSRMLPLLVLFVIPVVNLIAPFLWALFGAWGMALEFMAYPYENNGLLFVEQKNEARSRRIGVLTFGGLTLLGLSVPIFNLIVAPAAVIAATIYVNAVPEKD